MLNISGNFSELLLNASLNPGTTSSCIKGGQYVIECLYKQFCPQFSEYFINMGLTIIIIYILHGWLLWAYFKWLNGRIDWEGIYKAHPGVLALVGDLRKRDTMIYWEAFVRDKVSKIMLGYIVVVVYLYWSNRFS